MRYLKAFPAHSLRDVGHPTTARFGIDKTPNYLPHPLAIQRMGELLPSAGVVVILRNPVDRAYSAFQHHCRHGRWVESRGGAARGRQVWWRESEDCCVDEGATAGASMRVLSAPCQPEDFQQALETANDFGDMSRMQMISWGSYHENVEDLLAHFPPDQILVLWFEHAMKDVLHTLQDIEAFVGLRDTSAPGLGDGETSQGTSQAPRSAPRTERASAFDFKSVMERDHNDHVRLKGSGRMNEVIIPLVESMGLGSSWLPASMRHYGAGPMLPGSRTYLDQFYAPRNRELLNQLYAPEPYLRLPAKRRRKGELNLDVDLRTQLLGGAPPKTWAFACYQNPASGGGGSTSTTAKATPLPPPVGGSAGAWRTGLDAPFRLCSGVVAVREILG